MTDVAARSRRAARRREVTRRRRRSVATMAAGLAGCIMVVAGGAITAGWADEPPVTARWAHGSAHVADELGEGIRAAIAEHVAQREQRAESDAETGQQAASEGVCSAEVEQAIADGDHQAAIAAAGGGEAVRAAVVSGEAPCISLADPRAPWAVVNKQRAVEPIDFSPEVVLPQATRVSGDGALVAEAAAALDALTAAAAEAGAGEIAVFSAFRSHETQQRSYASQVQARGQEGADLTSARPGFSEHQLGLAADVVACAGGCGTIYQLAGTTQGEWIADNAWKHGWIIRYVAGATSETGYEPEPWHLRYVGHELAAAYHQGGFTTLEEFFGLPPAPGYAD